MVVNNVIMDNKKLETALEKWQSIQPISDVNRERLSQRFTVDFNYNSNHIEGNTLTYGQTELLLLFGKVYQSGLAPAISKISAGTSEE